MRIFETKYLFLTGGFAMKQLKKFSALAISSMAAFLLLGTSMAQAQEVCLEDDTVTGIKGLSVLTRSYGGLDIDVDFRYTTAYDMYGLDLDQMPFLIPWQEFDALAVVGFINDALSTNSEIPGSAGQSSENTYYVAIEEETRSGFAAVGVVGGANYTGLDWDLCKEEGAVRCVLGIAVLQADQLFSYAHLSRAVPNATCDGDDPPPPAPLLTNDYGVNGLFVDEVPASDGFDFNVHDAGLTIFYYGHTATGERLWLSSQLLATDLEYDTPYELDMFEVLDGIFGLSPPGGTVWGTLTFTLIDCNTIIATLTGFDGTVEFNLIRLAGSHGSSCQ
jgi:hypothetical protein